MIFLLTFFFLDFRFRYDVGDLSHFYLLYDKFRKIYRTFPNFFPKVLLF